MRVKYRYLLGYLLHPDSSTPDMSLTPQSLQNTLMNAIQEYYGEFGLGLAMGRCKVIYLALLTGTVLIRVPAEFEKQARVAVSSLIVVNSRRCVVNVIHVGGTIRSCQKELVKHNVNALHRQMIDCEDEKQRNNIKEALERTLEEIRRLTV